MDTNTVKQRLRGVVAAVVTPVDACGLPDQARFVRVADYLLTNGCDALNVLGTTGEATSFTAEQRSGLMRGIAAELPLDRMMVGTGAAAVGDAVELTRLAGELGFAGADLPLQFPFTVGRRLRAAARREASFGIRRPDRRAQRFVGQPRLCAGPCRARWF